MENKLLPHLLDQSLIPTMILSLRPTRQKHDFSATLHCNVLKEKSEEKTLVWPSLPGGQVLILLNHWPSFFLLKSFIFSSYKRWQAAMCSVCPIDFVFSVDMFWSEASTMRWTSFWRNILILVLTCHHKIIFHEKCAVTEILSFTNWHFTSIFR